MAKRITALKCPQCGSIKKQSIKEDHYICNHCDTEYFLDNDDINVNVNHNHRSADKVGTKEINKKNIAIGFAAFFLIFIVFFANLLFSPKSSSRANNDEVYTDRTRNRMLYTGADGKPKLFFSIERSYNAYSKKETEYFFLFYDPIADRVLNEQMPTTKWSENPTIWFRKFSDGLMYCIPDKLNQLYVLDEQSNQMLDVSAKMLHSKKEFASGIATLQFVNDNYGDAFQIMTNDGKEYYYYPIADRIYTDGRELDDDAERLNTLPADAREKKYYIFSEESSDYPDMPIQLIQYLYREKPGYPIRLPYGAEWKNLKDDNFKDYKTIFGYSDDRVSSQKDLTPGRTYFKPHIMYQEENRLYIKVLPNANPENVPLLQKIDTETGEIHWTYKPEGDKAEFTDITVSKDGIGFYMYGLGSQRFYKFILLNDKDGKLIKEIDLDHFKLK